MKLWESRDVKRTKSHAVGTSAEVSPEARLLHLAKKSLVGDFPGGPTAKTVCSPCRKPRFHPWSGN